MRFLLAAFLLIASCVDAAAQGCGPSNPNCIVPTAPVGTSDNRAASTAFVQQNVPGFLPTLQPGQVLGNNGSSPAVAAAISGVDSNALNTQTVNYTIQTSDCGKTIQAGTGSTGFFTVTLPSVSGFAATCSLLVKNADTTRGKGLSGFPSDLNNVLWPQQSVGVKIVNGAWVSFYQPGRYNISTSTSLFFDPINGSDNNDCLAASTSACATVAHAGTIYSQQWAVNAQVTIHWPTASATYNNASGQDYFDVPTYVGSGSIVLVGNQGTPDNVHIQMSTVANAVFSFNYTGGTYTVSGFKIDSSVGSGNGNGLFVQGSTHVFYNNMDFGAFVGGFMVSGEFGAQIVSNGNNTISGGAASYLLCQDGAVCHDTGFTDTITGTPSFSTAFLWAHGPGAVVGVLAATFSGSATGTKCEADAAGYVDVDTAASLPGNSTCLALSGGTVGNLYTGVFAVGATGSSSGTQTWKAAATTSGTITWPSGTVDFSGTGGTSQVVKQTSSGAIFTVGQLACADLSNAVASCSTDATNASNISSGSLSAARLALSTGVANSGGNLVSNAQIIEKFSPGQLAAVVNTKGSFTKWTKAATVDNLEGSATSFTCSGNPTITFFECGTSTTCASSPTTIGTVTVTAAGTVVDGTVSNPAITAGDYTAWAVSAGTCTALDIVGSANIHSN